MNLTVDLRVNKNRSAITLNGTAADKNFADYRLEFADIKTPGNWNLIMPPSDIPVVNDRFTDWAPPNEGTFLVRLTAWDKAGNQTAVQKKVVWGISTLVAGSYIDNSFIAPKNPDNPKKTVTLNYTALDAVHLEFTIVNDKGDTIRSFTREQTGYAVDSIVWDGRDENGTLVPDGKYTIKLFDYEFGVEVDNTLPTVSIGLSGITYDKKQSIYSVKLSASAADVRLKKWTLQVGTGENPQDWSTVASGTDNISTYSYQYINGEIAFLKYKRFRIVAEDFAGNQSFAISPLLESKVIFAGFVDNKNILNILDDGSGVNWAKGVVYNLMGFESVALPTQKVILQFSDGSGWKDAQEQLDGGLISFLWQHPDNVTKPYGLRFKEVTASGSENFSRIVKVNEIFSGGYTCRGLLGQIYLFESLQKLEVTVTSSTGKSITQLFENSSVPVGDFGLPVPVEAKGAVHSYLISMKGTGLNGGVYTFLNFSLQPLPSECKGDGNVGGSNSGGDNGGGGGGGGSTLAFDVIYPEALACGKTSGGILLPTERLSLAGAKRVDYLVKVGTTQQVIGEVDIEHEGPVRVSVDSSLLPSGSYPLSVIVTNTDNTQKQTDLGKVVVFDTESPQAKLFLPASPCPVRTVTPKGTRLGVDVSGSATDNIRVDHYALYYGLGDNPTSWSPAMSMGSDGVSKPIAGDGAVSGRLGTWDITDIPGSVFTLKLEVVDAAGNKGCATGVVKVDREIKINGYNLAPLIFSPNNDGILDTVTTGFSLDEPATVDLSVYTIAKDINGTDVLGALQRHVQSGLQFAGGAATFDWDGKGDSGAVLPDNRYGVSLTVTDACSNTATQWKAVDLDNTPPVISIDYPLPGNPLPPGVMIEIKGTATDPHFKSYLLEAGEGNTPATWITLASAGKPISNGVITSWNTFGLKNIWTLRLTAEDTVGNKKVATSTIDLGIRKELVKSLDATPKLFSPNNDQKLDTSLISYEVTDACNLRIDILDGNGQVVRTFTTVTTAAGTGSYVWDGKNSLGSVVPDGSYTVRLAASLSANPQTAQTETISLVVDTTPPAITIADLTDKSYLNRTDLSITGTISDTNLAGYNIAVVGPSGTTTLNAGTQNRANYTFGRLTDLTEDTYTLTVDASDLGQNQSKLVRTIIIDRTPPKVTLDTPKGGEFYGNTRNVIDISGTIVEKNLDRYSLRYGVGETPIDWKEVVGGDTIPTTAKLFSLKVGKTDGIADGIYTLSLYAKDKAGLEGEARTKIVIDNTPPQVAITSPKDGDYVTKSLDIKGTVADTYFDNGTLELAVGSCASAVKWAITKTLSASVQDSILDSWKVLPTDGEYCLRLLATDKSGNKSETKIGIKIDTHPPFAPQLTGKIDNKVDAVLSWTKSTEPDFAGYNLYRNSQKVNVTLLTDITYRDAALKEGSYIYTVKAVDFAGNESDPSNTVTLKIDLTGPTVRISTPKDGAAVSNLIDVKGTAYSQDDFKEYRVYIGQGSSPSSWTLIRRSPLPISYGSLAQWDTITNQDGSQYTLKLEGEDTNGNISTTQVSVAIDNTPPKAPVLLTTVATGADVALTWKANTEADLAGYLLYRNDQLAKVKGIVAGNIKPYLVTGTAYADKALPDGTYRYYLVAMDQAGNAGDQSNTLEVSIDTHPPHMTITAPTNGQKFESKLTINAETPDNDIATVQFQYKRPQDVVWTNLGAQFVKSPYITYFDPKGQNLPYGDYQFQVLSTDQHNNNDKTPTVVTVTYADLTPPEVPTGLAAKVTGADVNLTWTAVSETGVSYNIYRWNSETKSVVNSVPVKTASFVDLSLPDGTYQYEITALDVAGNESKASGQATAKIYAPIIIQPFTPLKNPALVLDGNGVDPGTPVQVTTTLPSEVASTATITADAAGAFRLEGITLALGENRFAAVATDSAGNISRNSETIVIVYDMPPAAPTGLVAAVQDYSVQLTWDPNSEQGILGYNLFRDNEKVNTGVDLTGGQATASYQDYYSMPQNAFDGNNGIYWGTSYGNGTFTPAWWQISLLAPELINRVEIDWQQGDWDSVNNRYNIFAGKDYEVQAWTGYNWVTLKKIVGNDQQTNTIDISPSYRTNQIRISITSTTDQNYSKYVRINEIRFRKDNLLSSPQYMDTGLSDNSYNYTVSAVDSYGLESDPSSPVEAIVGDVIPPTAPTNLKASVNVSEVILDWSTTPNTEPDLAGYSIYWQDGQNWVNRDDVSATTLTYTVSSLPNGIYHYRITAYDLVGNESDPSNVVSATVSIVSNPPLLSVTTPPERQTLIASWQASGGTTVAYNLYRSQLSGGGYIRVNPSPVQNLSYKDVGLTNGTAYYYVVTSLDQLGNESAYSKEAFGVPQDIAPARPIIFAPIKAGEQLVVYNDGIDVVGSTEPGLSVELLRGGDIVGSVTALMGNVHTTKPFDINGYMQGLSPDGTAIVFNNKGAIWLKKLDSGSVTMLANAASGATWSPDGGKIAFSKDDSYWYQRIVIYDVASATSTFLTDDTSVNEYLQSWSDEGTKIAFRSNRSGTFGIWLKNLTDNTLIQVADNIIPSNLSLSPDAAKVAYFTDLSLFVINISDGKVSQIDDRTDQYSIAWTPDSNKIAFISYKDGDNGLFVTDLTNQVTTKVLGSLWNNFSQPVWSPDGTRIVYNQFENYGRSLRMVGLGGEQAILLDNLSYIYPLGWTKNGYITFGDDTAAHTLKLKGTFTIPKVQLVAGENQLYAIANDGAGFVSPPSDSISVVFDTGNLPDLSITDSDLTFFPPYPKPGDDVVVTARVHNPTNNPVDNATVELYLWDGMNDVTLLTSEIIPHLDANGEGEVSVRFNAGTTIGTRTVIAVADPANLIAEVSKTNNYASKDLIVTDQEKVTLTSSLNATQYVANQDLFATVKLHNSGLPKTGMLYVAVEDATGTPVKVLTNQSTELPYGADTTQTFSWNTITTFSGAYRLHATISDGSTVLGEGITPFSILPDLKVSAGIVTDRQQYGSRQDVGLAVSFKNTGVNYLIPQLRARVRVLGPQNTEQYSGEQTVANLMTGASGSLSFTWNTGLLAPGPYTATLDIFAGDKLVTSSLANFTIIPSVSIGGSIKADPAVAVLGSGFTANYTLTNNGNAGASGTAQVSLIDQDTSTVVATTEQATILPLGNTVPGNAMFQTDGLKLKNYLLKLNFVSNGNSTVIATTPLSIKDGTPPVLTVSTLADGSLASSSVLNIAGTVTDNVGVKQLLINGVSVPFGPDGTFSHALLLKPGENKVEVQATDLAGNSASDSRTIYQDQRAPVLVVTSPADNSKTNKQQIDVTGHVDETSTVEVRVNGLIQPVTMDGNNFTASVTLQPGAAANTIDITATNLAMKSSSDKRSVYYDDQAPALAITAPGQDIRTNQANLTIRGTASDLYGYGVTVSLDVNGQKFTPQLIDGKFEQAVTFTTEETYHIEATATNEMGTSSSVQRNVIYDITPPAFTIDKVISPTNQQSQVVSGTRDTDATVTVSCITATVGPVEYPTATTWKASLNSLTAGDNTITATATDGAGNPNSVPVHIIYDSTPPTGSILINNGAGFTAVTQVTLNLSAADANNVTTMRLSNDGSTWTDPESCATTRVWNLLSGDGQKTVYVQYKDAAENWTVDPIVASIVLDTTPPIVTATPAGGTYNTTQTVQLMANETAIIYYTINGATPTTASAVYSRPLTIASNTTLKSLAIDSAGNPGIHTEGYVIDTIPPTGTIAINSGATITNSAQVMLTLSASDANGVSKMRFSNDGSAWSDSENYATSRVWYLASGDGTKRVFASYQDTAGNWSVPVSADITLDTIPPVVSASPAGGIFNTPQSVKLTASENSVIRFTTDGSTPAANSAVYHFPIPITASTTLHYMAVDTAGNPSDVKTESYIIDTIPPTLTVSTLANGAYTNNQVLNIAGSATDTSGINSLTINGAGAQLQQDGSFSQALVLQPGPNAVTVVATDLASNSSTDARTVNLDMTVPQITITSPADNTKTATSVMPVTGSVSETSTVSVKLGSNIQNAVMNATAFSASVNLSPGTNTIEVTAIDPANNARTQKRTVVYDNQKPSLTITDPPQDIRTNLSGLILRGTVSDIYTQVNVTITMDGQSYTPPVVNGSFQQALTFTQEKNYAILVTATNEAGGSTSTQRNVIYDVTPPALTINPVTSPTMTDSQTISGTREASLDVSVSSSTATIGIVTYPTSTTWQVSVTGLKPGSNIITVSTTDAANNVASASKEIVYTVSTLSGNFSAAIFGNAKVTMSNGSYTDSYVGNPATWSKGQHKNGDIGTNSLQSCAIQITGGTQVFGKAWVGHGGNPVSGVSVTGGSSITGGTGALAVAKDMTPKKDPAGGTALGALTLTGGASRTLTAGEYRITSLDLSNGTTLTLNGAITLHNSGNFSINGGSKIVITNGPVVIYQNGQKIDISNGVIVNNSQSPKNFTIYGTQGLKTINLTGGTSVHALIYAPTAAITISGGQNTFGSVIGNTVDISGGSSVHYDESLKN
jgi:flagellar hook assembly protein FlgD